MSKHWREAQAAELDRLVRARRVTPLTPGQANYLKAMESFPIVLCSGMAGTGKSFLATNYALQCLREGLVKKVILTRPLVSCGRGFGFLPGDQKEKSYPFMRPMIDAADEAMGEDSRRHLFAKGQVEVLPLELMRGTSLRETALVCDEAQNAEYGQLHMLLTRIGQGSRFFVSGDSTQSDLPVPGKNPFLRVMHRLAGCKKITHVFLTRRDVVRSSLVTELDRRLGSALEDGRDEILIGGRLWYQDDCPKCDARVWWDSGSEKEQGPDVEHISCWNCLGTFKVNLETDETEMARRELNGVVQGQERPERVATLR